MANYYLLEYLGKCKARPLKDALSLFIFCCFVFYFCFLFFVFPFSAPTDNAFQQLK